MIFPIAKSDSRRKVAIIIVASSGSDVPTATNVKPISASETLKSWREIVGEEYYKLSKPNKIKKSQVSLKDTATLQLKVDPTIAFAIEHDQTKIMSKINGFFNNTKKANTYE